MLRQRAAGDLIGVRAQEEAIEQHPLAALERGPDLACDELCGFLVACALVQPSKALSDVKPSSVKKKLKDKAFARSVSRDDIYNGVAELGVDLEEHITFVREALLEIAGQIGV
jgi:predicted hydrolase (HD superfamily)